MPQGGATRVACVVLSFRTNWFFPLARHRVHPIVVEIRTRVYCSRTFMRPRFRTRELQVGAMANRKIVMTVTRLQVAWR